MKLVSIFLPFLCVSAVTSQGHSFFGGAGQSPLVDDTTLDVPGKNPLTFCADPSTYILDIDYVNLSPNPPIPGQNLTITASGTFSKDVEPGATVALVVKYGLITIVRTVADLCDQIGNVDLSCPLKKGPMNATKEVAIPKQVPKGKYTVTADVMTQDEEKVTCLNAVVFFT